MFRDANGELQPGKERFPNGMKYVADRLHELGLKVESSLSTCTASDIAFAYKVTSHCTASFLYVA